MQRTPQNFLHNQFFSVWPFQTAEYTSTGHTAARCRMVEAGSGELRVKRGVNNSKAPRFLRDQPNLMARVVAKGSSGDVLIRQRLKRGMIFNGERLFCRLTAMGPRAQTFEFGIDDYTAQIELEGIANSRDVTGITKANPAVVTVSGSSQPFTDGEQVYLENVGGMTEVNGQMFIVENASTSSPWTFELQQYVSGVATNYDSTANGTYTSGGDVYEPKPVTAEFEIILPPQSNTDLFFYPFINPSANGTYVLMAMGLWSIGAKGERPEWEYRTEAQEWRLMEQFLRPIYNGQGFVAAASTNTSALYRAIQAPPGGWHKTPAAIYAGPTTLNITALLAGTALTGTGGTTATPAISTVNGAREGLSGWTWSGALTSGLEYVLSGSETYPIIVLDADE